MKMRQNPVGQVEVSPDEGWRWGKLRDGLGIAVPFTITFSPVDLVDGPICELGVDERDGALVVTTVTLRGSVDSPISSDAVRVYALGKLTAIGAHHMAMPARGWKAFDEGETWPPSNARVMESIVSATRARVNVDRDRLADVAEWFARGGVTAVQEGLNVSRSQAYRLVRVAKEQGHIEED